MPNYDFKCEDCGHRFCKMVSFKEKDEVKCIECDSDKTKQIFTSFMIKGANSPGTGGSSGCGSCSGGSCC